MERRVSASQIDELLDFLESHPSLAKGSVGLGGRSKQTIERKWDELAICMNAHGTGATKNGQRWRRYCIDLKHRVKSRAAQYRQDATGIGGGHANVESSSKVDRRIMAILGQAPIFGDTEHQVPFGDFIVQPVVIVEEQIENISEPCPSKSAVQPAPEMEPKIETPSGYHKRINKDWVIELEEKRVEAEGKLLSAALVMAEASRIQAEASRMQAEASRMQAEVALMQMKIAQEMSPNMSKLIEILKK
ncbi:unnamed protein product [Acanthoscelides obtectus]|uniref:Regulatory protein zeste n=1 Tax=Acanthoscelides obtectus TaxID=200917 RepID=A0A9P0PQ26_ACAOB|nr:unnamed protein product [Acanthoscelides obtectus]CAK1658407.1 hypothetical protein AOBTE_LOCUS20866 [Acanthoscelides obtectus]